MNPQRKRRNRSAFIQAQIPEQAKAKRLQLDILNAQYSILSWPYYTTVKFKLTREDDPLNPGGFLYRSSNKKIKGFSYGVESSRVAAGFTTADGLATLADTNITEKAKTISGEEVLIFGVSFQLLPMISHKDDGRESDEPKWRLPDPEHVAATFAATSVTMEMNGGKQQYHMGTINMIPGAGGLLGGGSSALLKQPIGGTNPSIPFASNGWPTNGNYFKLPEGLVWRSQGQTDSQMQIAFQTEHEIVLYSGGSPENRGVNIPVEIVDPTLVATSQQSYNYPTELVFGLQIQLIGQVESPRSNVS